MVKWKNRDHYGLISECGKYGYTNRHHFIDLEGVFIIQGGALILRRNLNEGLIQYNLSDETI
jgi:hypothetical protein